MSDSHFDLIYGEIFGNSVIDDKAKKTKKVQKVAEVAKAKKEEDKEEGPVQVTEKNRRKIKMLRKAGTEEWYDTSLADWPENDFRIYCCNMGNEVNEDVLSGAFKKYASFAKVKVVRDKKTEKSKGYGFISLLDRQDYINAMREVNGKYVGNRPI